MNNRKVAGWIVGIGCLVQFAAWEASVDALVPGFAEPAASAPATPRAAAPTTAPAPTASASTPPPNAPPKKGTAMGALVRLNVWEHQPTPGYRRTKFGKAWADTDENHCDQRNDTLRRDLRKRHTQPGSRGCILAKGILVNPYTGNSIKFDRGDGDVQIDHVVSLHDAWNAGASEFTAEQRRQFANDPLNLIATSSHSNQAKGDDRADEWLPAEWTFGVRCDYVRRQIAVKKAYGLSVTLPERVAMGEVLEATTDCYDSKLPARLAFSFPTPRPIGEPKPKATPHRTAQPRTRQQPRQTTAPRRGVHPGAFCAPAGAQGVTVTGRRMTCKATSSDDRNRWRS